MILAVLGLEIMPMPDMENQSSLSDVEYRVALQLPCLCRMRRTDRQHLGISKKATAAVLQPSLSLHEEPAVLGNIGSRALKHRGLQEVSA